MQVTQDTVRGSVTAKKANQNNQEKNERQKEGPVLVLDEIFSKRRSMTGINEKSGRENHQLTAI